MVGRQIGAKPAAFAGVATRKGRAYGRAVFPRIKHENNKKMWADENTWHIIYYIKSILKKIMLEGLHYITSRLIIKLQ